MAEVLKRLVAGELRWPLFLHGPAGAGKTSAALVACDHIESAVFSTVDCACDREMRADKCDAFEFWSAVERKHLAVLDEIGVRANVGELHFVTVKKIADLREQCAGRAAIYISNVPPRSIKEIYDDRIASRLLCGTLFNLQSPDRRPTS